MRGTQKFDAMSNTNVVSGPEPPVGALHRALRAVWQLEAVCRANAALTWIQISREGEAHLHILQRI